MYYFKTTILEIYIGKKHNIFKFMHKDSNLKHKIFVFIILLFLILLFIFFL